MTLKPTQQRLLLMLGWLHLQCGQPRRAQVLLEALLSVAPERRDGRRALLLALLQQGLGEPPCACAGSCRRMARRSPVCGVA